MPDLNQSSPFRCKLEAPPRLMFITHRTPSRTEYDEARLALAGGCAWVQLRMKTNLNEATAVSLVRLCRDAYPQAVVCIDDDVEIALRSGADAVHLGKNDRPLREAWEIVGQYQQGRQQEQQNRQQEQQRCQQDQQHRQQDQQHRQLCQPPYQQSRQPAPLDRPFFIGATANTFEDIRQAVAAGASYIGLGPYRFTETKKKLSPILGLEGYRKIVRQCEEANFQIPIFAIGGILLADVAPLMETGIHGIAVSGAIIQAPDPAEATRKFLNELNKY